MSSDKFIRDRRGRNDKNKPPRSCAPMNKHKHGRMHSLLEERVLCYPFNHSTTNRRPPFLPSFLCRPEITSFQRFINREGNRSMDKLFGNTVLARYRRKFTTANEIAEEGWGKILLIIIVWIIVSSGRGIEGSNRGARGKTLSIVIIRLDCMYGEISWLTMVGKSINSV